MVACADPESFVRGGLNLITFFVFFFKLMRGWMIQIPLSMGHHRPTSKRHLNGVFAAGPMMTQL